MAILWKHGLRNISVTLLTLVGLQVNRLLSGAVVIEAVFAIPGAGSLVAYSAINKDFPVVQGVVLVFVIMIIVINLARRHRRARCSIRGRCRNEHREPSSQRRARDGLAPQPVARRCFATSARVLSLGYLALLLIVSIFAAQIAPYSPIDQNVAELLMPPSAAHWLGTDDLGRDVLSRLIWGAPNSLYASTFAVSVAHCARRAGRSHHRLRRRLARRDRQPLHRRAAVVPADRAGDRRHRRARHRAHQRHAVGRHRVRAGAGAPRPRADADRQAGASMSMPRARSAHRPRRSSSATSCRTPSSRSSCRSR